MEQGINSIEGKYITFVLGREEYGVSLNKVREILESVIIEESEHHDPCVKGIMKIRNQKVPVLDLRCRFGMGDGPARESYTVLIAAFGPAGVITGLIVDSIRQVLHIHTKVLERIETSQGDPRADYVVGVVNTEGRPILILNLDKGADLLPVADLI
jgi:purine-binding chemotaxis protein CheW